MPRMPRMVKNHLLSPEASKKETKRNPGKSDLKLSTLNHGQVFGLAVSLVVKMSAETFVNTGAPGFNTGLCS